MPLITAPCFTSASHYCALLYQCLTSLDTAKPCRCRPKPLYASPYHRQDLRLDAVPLPGLSLTSPALPLRVNASPYFALPMPKPLRDQGLLCQCLAIRCRCVFRAPHFTTLSVAVANPRVTMPLHVQGYSTLCHSFGLPHLRVLCLTCSALPLPGHPLLFTAVPVAARYITLRRYACACPLHGASPHYAGADSTQNDAPLYHGNLVHRFALQNRGYAILSLPSTCFASLRLLCPR